MAQANARSFLEQVANHEVFRRDVMSELERTTDKTPQQLVQLGQKHGFAFTETELADALAMVQRTGKQELSDSDLEGVAGGTGVIQDITASLKLMGEILSNVSKTRSEISMTFAGNVRA